MKDKPQVSGQTPRGQIILTLEELKWLTNQTERKIRTSILDIKNKRLRSALMSLQNKLEAASANLTEPIIVPTSRIELRILAEWCKITISAIAGPIRSNYLDRYAKDPEHFQAVIDSGDKLVEMLTKLHNKMEKAL